MMGRMLAGMRAIKQMLDGHEVLIQNFNGEYYD
jgi:hypothetical protein